MYECSFLILFSNRFTPFFQGSAAAGGSGLHCEQIGLPLFYPLKGDQP